ncbi:MAG TPA: biotin/lipoyl-containing protein [Negativicutes bacterium]
MSMYTITINGKAYDVSVEKKDGAPTVKAAAPAPVAAPASNAGAVGTKISAPMPGNIIDVKVEVGDNVKKGQELIILEAMKMRNPMLAVTDGVIQAIYVKPGDAIQTGTILLVIG